MYCMFYIRRRKYVCEINFPNPQILFRMKKKSFKMAQNYQKLSKNFEVEKSLKTPEDFCYWTKLLKKVSIFISSSIETGYFPKKNLKNRSTCIGLHHSLKSVSTALTTSSMRRKIRILLGNPVHAWRATECTWLRFHHISSVKNLLVVLV